MGEVIFGGDDMDVDGVVNRMREARSVPAVIKATLANLRAEKEGCVVFFCEGIDDKKVYYHWLSLLGFPTGYEFITCGGKGSLLRFRASLKRDLSGLGGNSFFLLDKDFDGLRNEGSGTDVYMTETYSFENELVCEEVLENILVVDLHCNADPRVREKVLSRFKNVYDRFLIATKLINYRLFVARRLGIEVESMPERINQLARVDLLSIECLGEGVEETVVLREEPSKEEDDKLWADFCQLVSVKEYRGKFALLFFLRWLDLLCKDKNSDCSALFSKENDGNINARFQPSLDLVVSRSRPPASFCRFIEKIEINPTNLTKEQQFENECNGGQMKIIRNRGRFA